MIKADSFSFVLDLSIYFPEVIESHHLASAYDYMLKVLMEDTDKLEIFLSEKLKFIQGVQKSNTLIILSTVNLSAINYRASTQVETL
ncbi:Lrp/AsnC ligand binding domain-containing protein [Sporosarcina sp. FA9]|uniref:Lrp/AsnC ligand binding domain-containing protein n=1 Tax=Sporosarcina sp. FA9 TaxID=3413030 RepID=UPI003F656F66